MIIGDDVFAVDQWAISALLISEGSSEDLDSVVSCTSRH